MSREAHRPWITGAGALGSPGRDRAATVASALGVRGPDVDLARELAGRLPASRRRRMGRCSQLCVAAAAEALRHAGLTGSERVGVVVGTALGNLDKTEVYLQGIADRGLLYANPLDFADSMDNAAAAHCSLMLGLGGPALTVTARETTGELAVIEAAAALADDGLDAMVAVAGDAAHPALDRLPRGWAVDHRVPDLAAAVVLERPEAARRRGATPLGRLLGHSQACGRVRRRLTRPGGPELLETAMRRAIAEASAERGATMAPREVEAGRCMSDGVLRVIVALERLRDPAATALVARGARGGTAAALVLGAAPRA